MKRFLLAGTCVLSLTWTTAAKAQFVCANCATEFTQVFAWVQQLLNDVRELALSTAQVEQLYVTYRSFYGVRDIGSAMAMLNTLGIQNPLPVDLASVQYLVSGRGSPGNIPATIASLLSGNLSANNVYTPQPTDWSAQQMIENAQSLAGIQALSQRAYQAGADRLLQLAGLRVRLATANDPKEVMDLQAQIAAAQSDAQAQQIQAGNIQTLAALQPRVMEQRDEEHERLTICNYIAFLRGNEDGIAPAPDCTSQSVGTMATGQANLTPGGSGAGSGSGSALASMMNQSWGQTAANNAAALGVNPEALAATCVVESGCQNVSNANSTASGPFQMIDSTYQADLQQALATNPELASQVVGKSDPATESIAAAEYLKSAATGLQQSNIPNPTVLDVRGAYQFGPANAAALATADDSQSMSSILANYSQQTLAANGITPGMTVGQWRQSIVNKLGPSAYAPVLATNT